MAAKYITLANRLKKQIDQSKGTRSYKLPTEQELCERYSVSRQTVRLALSMLTEEGYIRKRQGSGSFALPPALRNQNREFAIVLSSDSEYLYPSVLMNLQTAIRQSGNRSSLFLTESDIRKERYILESILHSSIDGVFIEGIQTSLPNPNLDIFEQLITQHKQITFIQHPYVGLSQVSSIRMDDFYGGYLVGKHISAKHHKQISALFQADSLTGTERYAGLNAALKDSHSLIAPEHICWYTTFQYEQLQKKQDNSFLKEFLQKQLLPCSCIICQNDEIAYWLIKELVATGYHVPVDISVISFGNSYLSELSYPAITSLAPRALDFTTLLSESIQHNKPLDHAFSWNLVEKGSVSVWNAN